MWLVLLMKADEAKITLWASTCWPIPSSYARVTSAKLLSSFKFPKAQLCHSYWPTFSSEKYEKPLHNTTFHKEGAERTRLQSLRQRAGRSLRTERSWRTKRAQRAQRALSTECLCPEVSNVMKWQMSWSAKCHEMLNVMKCWMSRSVKGLEMSKVVKWQMLFYGKCHQM